MKQGAPQWLVRKEINMSAENVMKFFGKMEEDPSLKKKVLALDDKSRAVVESSVNEMVEIAKAAGFEFSAQELVLITSFP